MMGPGLFRLLLSSVVVIHHYSSFAIGSTIFVRNRALAAK